MVNYKFATNEISSEIKELAKQTGLLVETAAILSSRGVDTKEKVDYFLNPGKHHFKNPFLLKGVREAVERIKLAKEEGETVLIYGDYDADGISATTVLYYALKDFGINALTVVPERTIGYGLQIDFLNDILEDYFPTLIITVDCGISCYKEVEYLKSEGIDVIVTDHHELPDVLPNCTLINCKIPCDYGFEGLCGAGVAYKLAYALIGEKADKYLDFVAIATIADSMPIIDENRDIVFEGVKLIKSGKAHPAINELIAISNMREVNSTSLAFTIAPRINAAGRMGDASSALKLMKSDDTREIEELAIKLNNYNVSRQIECESLYQSARKKLITSAYNKKIVVLSSEEWNSGLVGIIAAKLVEEFSRPVILFVQNGDSLHGSARSIENINIFEAISACKEVLIDFGGHAQAAGVTVSSSNFAEFCRRIEEFVDKTYDYSFFKPQKTVELEFTKPFSLELARELNRLEPFGTGNRRPLFSIKTEVSNAQPIKLNSPHLLISTDYIDMLYFNGLPMLNLINAGTKKEIIFESNITVFNREESLKGYVKYIDFSLTDSVKTRLNAYRQSLLTALNDNDDYLYVSSSMTERLVDECISQRYGNIFAIYNLDNLSKFEKVASLDSCLYSTLNRNLLNNLVLGLNSLDIVGYKRIIYLDRPLGNVPKIENVSETFIDRSIKAYDYSNLSTDKAVLGDIFKKIKQVKVYGVYNSVDFALKTQLNYPLEQVVFALEVFGELDFITFKNGLLRFNEGVRSSLDASKIYSEVLKLK